MRQRPEAPAPHGAHVFVDRAFDSPRHPTRIRVGAASPAGRDYFAGVLHKAPKT